MIDGELSETDIKFLRVINNHLELSEDNLLRILAMYRSYQEEKSKQQEEKSRPRKANDAYKRKQSALILGVDINSTNDEIKKAYRQMVQLHHPDKFQNSTSEQQKIAEEKFIQIQKAYEVLLTKKGASKT